MREYRKDKIRRHRITLSEEGLSNSFRFISVYGFKGTTLEKIEKNKATKDLRGYKVCADTLYIDVDTFSEEVLSKVRKALSPYVYAEYLSGGKGHHFHVPHQPIDSEHLINSHKEFIKKLGLIGEVDTSIYRESGLIRRPFTVHERTGNKKELLHVNHEGDRLELDLVEKEEILIDTISLGNEAELKYRQNLLRKVDIGGRHRHFYILWLTGKKAGRQQQQIENDILWYNSLLDVPKEEREVKKEIRGFG